MPSWSASTEFTFFNGNAAFQNDPTISTPSFDILINVGAHSPCYYGQKLDDPSIGYTFVNWDSYEVHEHATSDPKVKEELLAASKKVLTGPPGFCNVNFSGPPIPQDKPLMQVTELTAKSTSQENGQKVGDILSQIASKIGPNFAYGPTHESPNVFLVTCGQTSMKGSWEVTEDQALKTLILQLFQLADKTMDIYTALMAYPKPSCD
ncbi:hypothetical protein JVU11DRAFT_10493 [Chiua virens]|nr:hypothetical protein JVU11DRAFT_10493 [Chiua virens]